MSVSSLVEPVVFLACSHRASSSCCWLFPLLSCNPEGCFTTEHDVVSPAVCASHGPGYEDVADVTALCDDKVGEVSVFGMEMHPG